MIRASARNVVVVDACGGNTGSVSFALQRLGIAAPLTSDAALIQAATHVILPGVGAAAPGMQRLREAGLVEVIRELSQPILGICLGMQLMFEGSAESATACLGIIPGQVRCFPRQAGMRVPHMGWNCLDIDRDSPLFAGIPAKPYMYFVHSYAAPVTTDTLASTDYCGRFTAVVRHRNFFGVQFHPERSGPIGAQLLKNFLEL